MKLNMKYEIMTSFPSVHRFREHRLVSKKANGRNSIPSVIIGDSLVRNFSRKMASLLFTQHFKGYLNFGIGGDRVENVHY